MSAYLPRAAASVATLGALVALSLLLGFVLSRGIPGRVQRALVWINAILGVAAIERVARTEPAGFRMVAIVVVLFAAMKAVVAVEARARGEAALAPLPWLAFSLGWPGMRPEIFGEDRRAVPSGDFRRETRRIVLHGTLGVVAGAVALVAASRSKYELAVALLALVGLSLTLHFGLFDLVTAFWRVRGVPCRPPFQQPIRSTSLPEFWGKRWNVPYVEMVALVLFRPLAGLLGAGLARFASFCFSGILHELAISVPVRAGWGRPFLYFVLQGLFVLAEERTPALRRAPPWTRRALTLLLVLIPAPLLFHPPFVRGVIEPIVGW